MSDSELAFVVFGASGHLSKSKTFPALFKLFKQNRLGSKFTVFGYARSDLSKEQFCASLNLSDASEFFEHLEYVRGKSYDDAESFKKLASLIPPNANRVCYCAVPPTLFLPICTAFKEHVQGGRGVYTRYVIEKPFGRDTESALELKTELEVLFGTPMTQVYLIDHYLGKYMVNNILQMRFGNPWFKPAVWDTIESVSIVANESEGTQGRGGYFDSYGTVRDMLQNHLLQIMTLLLMQEPATLDADHIREEKLKVLRGIDPVSRDQLLLGQYSTYTDDKTVPKNSRCPTYARCVLRSPGGVPVTLCSGKALDERLAAITLEFSGGGQLVLQIQPNPHVRMSLVGATPLESSEAAAVEDAYVLLIERVLQGDQSMFVSTEELLEAWRIFSPVLQGLEEDQVAPIAYEPGSKGPRATQSGQ